MKKILYTFVLVSILLNSVIGESISGVYNTTSGLVYTDMVHLKTTFVNQNPTSAVTGEYVDLLFKIENLGTEDAENVTFELLPQYPFSLDPGVSAKQYLGTITGLQRGDNAYLVKYKLKVDKDAVEGDNEIKIKYSYGDGNAYDVQTYNVSVSNSRTDFDIVAQDQSTLAIANIGANTAQSVIVRIPNQPNYRVNGTSATIIGNLNAGDYTLATFQIISTRASNISSNVSNIPSSISSGPSNLTVEISYTDTLGIRRTVDKNVSYGFSVSGFNATGRTFTRTGESLLSVSNGILYIIIGVVGIVIIVVVIKIRSRKKK
jgi:hypothetical protein